jgi:hypothetical protein
MKSSHGTRQTDGKNLVWFGEIERKLANYQRLPLLTVFPLNYFMVYTVQSAAGNKKFNFPNKNLMPPHVEYIK